MVLLGSKLSSFSCDGGFVSGSSRVRIARKLQDAPQSGNATVPIAAVQPRHFALIHILKACITLNLRTGA